MFDLSLRNMNSWCAYKKVTKIAKQAEYFYVEAVEIVCKMANKQSVKTWGEREFWGLNWDFDPQWILSEKQKEIQTKLIETCRAVIRPNAVSNASL